MTDRQLSVGAVDGRASSATGEGEGVVMGRVFPEGRLVYGMQLPVQSQSTIYAEPWEASATAADLAEVARAADRAGFGYLASCDHVAIPRRLAAAMSTVRAAAGPTITRRPRPVAGRGDAPPWGQQEPPKRKPTRQR